MFAPRAGRYLAPPAAIALAAAGAAYALKGGPGAPFALAGALLFGGLTAFFAVFFRDPNRPVGAGIVAPADGRIRSVEAIGDRVRVSIFMNVTNVHVNRCPLEGRVTSVGEAGRGHAPAYSVRSDRNVQRRYGLATEVGPAEIVQITGSIARRLVSFVAVGASLGKADRFGMIILGSRVDLYLPLDRVEISVRPGDRVRAGTTSIGRVRS